MGWDLGAAQVGAQPCPTWQKTATSSYGGLGRLRVVKFDLADTIITVRSLIRRSWTTHRWDERPNRRP